MITIKTKYGIVDLSMDGLERYRNGLGRHLPEDLRSSVDGKIADYFEKSLFRSIVKYMKKEGYPKPRNTRMLTAHGESSSDGSWMYAETQNEMRKIESVEDWLTEYDGNHDALVLLVCNEYRIRLKPRRSSFLIYPSGSIKDIEILLAGFGFLDNSVLRIVPPQKYKRLI